MSKLAEIYHFMMLTDQESEDCEKIYNKYQKARKMIGDLMQETAKKTNEDEKTLEPFGLRD